jgi:hypothetical protein
MSEKFSFEYIHAFGKGRPSSRFVGQVDKTCADLHMSAEYHGYTDDSVKTAIRRKRGTR